MGVETPKGILKLLSLLSRKGWLGSEGRAGLEQGLREPSYCVGPTSQEMKEAPAAAHREAGKGEALGGQPCPAWREPESC